MAVPTPQQILDLDLEPNDAGAATVRDYLIELLRLVWEHEQGFSGKRPFGNSGWQHDLYVPMAEQGWIASHSNQWDELVIDEPREADRLIDLAIQELGREQSTVASTEKADA